MDDLGAESLRLAEIERRFVPQKSELLVVAHKIDETKVDLPKKQLQTFSETFHTDGASGVMDVLNQRRKHDEVLVLQCILQRCRPHHVSGQADILPFRDRPDAEAVFRTLDLPAMFFQVANGSVAAILAHVIRGHDNRAHRFELVAYCLTKQGDWSLALTHNAKDHCTNVFWSIDKQINSHSPPVHLTKLSKDLASHPLFVPCVMLLMTVEMALRRRRSLKRRLSTLGHGLTQLRNKQAIDTASAQSVPTRQSSIGRESTARTLTSSTNPPLSIDAETEELTKLFEELQTCQKDQSSRKGRYDAWQSHHEAIQQGFDYVDELLREQRQPSGMATSDRARLLDDAQTQLRRWTAVLWRKLESLRARDQDHIDRVRGMANMLQSMVQQRDMRLQTRIAAAAQRDSEDMKFLTILGSIFLPASLVATVLNVPQFQFLSSGVQLFGAYLGITVPLIVLVLVLCMLHPYRHAWMSGFKQRWANRPVGTERPHATLV